MQENYLSKKQQENLVRKKSEKICDTSERIRGTYFVLYDGTVTSENPYQGKNQFDSDVDERKRFLRETNRL